MCSCKLYTNLIHRNLLGTINWQLRALCQVTAVQEKTREKRKVNKTHKKQLDAYLSSTPQLLQIKDKLPERCLRKNRTIPDDLYLIDNQVGKKIVNALVKDIKQNNAIVVETNPGFAFITEWLLKKGIPRIHAYEPTVAFRENLFVSLIEEFINIK